MVLHLRSRQIAMPCENWGIEVMLNLKIRFALFMVFSLSTFQVQASRVVFPFEEHFLRSFLSAELYLHEGQQIDYFSDGESRKCGYLYEYEVKNIYSGSAVRGVVFWRGAVPLSEGFYYALIFKSKAKADYERFLSKDDLEKVACYLDETTEYFEFNPSSVYPVVSDELGRERVFIELGNPLLPKILPEERGDIARFNGAEGYMVAKKRVEEIFRQSASSALKLRDK